MKSTQTNQQMIDQLFNNQVKTTDHVDNKHQSNLNDIKSENIDKGIANDTIPFSFVEECLIISSGILIASVVLLIIKIIFY